jgi:hypothetical protein
MSVFSILASDPNACVIPLTKGEIAIVDKVDAEVVLMFPWHVRISSRERVKYASGLPPGFRHKISLHRFLWIHRWGLERPIQLDHENREGLDCRRSNLRPASFSQNHANTARAMNNSTGVKGVVWSKAAKKFQAQIRVNKRLIYLGQFEKLADAAEAYAIAASVHFGEFARFDGVKV